MTWSKRSHLVSFICIAGLVAYLLRAALAAIFVVNLPMASGWCLEVQEVQTGENAFHSECVLFQNDFEEAKYVHNQSMVGRNKILLLSQLALWFGVTSLLFHLIPKWKGSGNVDAGGWFGPTAGIALAVSMGVPWLLSSALPPPYEWFPQVFRDISDAQIQAALRSLQWGPAG